MEVNLSDALKSKQEPKKILRKIFAGAALGIVGLGAASGALNSAAKPADDAYSASVDQNTRSATHTNLISSHGFFVRDTTQEFETVTLPANGNGQASYTHGMTARSTIFGTIALSEKTTTWQTLKEGSRDYSATPSFMERYSGQSSEVWEISDRSAKINNIFGDTLKSADDILAAEDTSSLDDTIAALAGKPAEYVALLRRVEARHGSIAKLQARYERESELAEGDTEQLLGIKAEDIDYNTYTTSHRVRSGSHTEYKQDCGMKYGLGYNGKMGFRYRCDSKPTSVEDYSTATDEHKALPDDIQERLDAARAAHQEKADALYEILSPLRDLQQDVEKLSDAKVTREDRMAFLTAQGGLAKAWQNTDRAFHTAAVTLSVNWTAKAPQAK